MRVVPLTSETRLQIVHNVYRPVQEFQLRVVYRKEANAVNLVSNS